ncbi:MAG: iron-sulfur cluster-binding protein [Planctomycetota bacterium]
MGLSILYRAVGRGTALLSGLAEGDLLHVLGPLGTGFTPLSFEGYTYLVGGGMGAAPLLFLAQAWTSTGRLAPDRTEVILGAPESGALAGLEDFLQTGLTVSVSTDDGSRGVKGTVVDLLEEKLEEKEGPARVFAVGPEGMYRGLRKALEGKHVSCEVSLESRMACGLGSCRSCVVPVVGEGGSNAYVDVCKRGPVFDLDEVLFDELDQSG